MPFPASLLPYSSAQVEAHGVIGGRVHVELADGRIIAGETWAPDVWDDQESIDWDARLRVTIDDRPADQVLDAEANDELRTWMLDVLAEAGALDPGDPIEL